MEGRTDKEVFLRGDATVQYQDLMDIIDMMKGAGVQNIGMVSRMPSAR
jgi:biopolymer transport protein ExbD